MRFFSQIQFDHWSYWLGFITASILWWLLQRVKRLYPQIRSRVELRKSVNQLRVLEGVEGEYRMQVLQSAQKAHLASTLAPLDALLIEPKLLVPTIKTDPDENPPIESLMDELIPCPPDFPEIASRFGVSTTTLAGALQSGANLVIIGQPGAGKTVALAGIASKLARKEESCGNVSDLLPVLIHTAEVVLDDISQPDPIVPIIQTLTSRFASTLQSRIERLLTQSLHTGKVILLLDGLDELHPSDVNKWSDYLARLLMTYPHLRIVATTTPFYIGNLMQIGMRPVTLAPWNIDDRDDFLSKWDSLWKQSIFNMPENSQLAPEINQQLLLNWLKGNQLHTPLEWTLHTWTAYSGASEGSTGYKSINAFVHHVCRDKIPVQALAGLAYEMITNNRASMDVLEIERFFSKFNPPESSDKTSGELVIRSLVEAGLMILHSNNQVCFSNIRIISHLASQFLTSDPDAVLNYDQWCTRATALQSMALLGKSPKTITQVFREDTILRNELLSLATCVIDTQKDSEEYSKMMRGLISILTNEDQPLIARTRALVAMIKTGDSSIEILIRKLLNSPSASLRRLGCMGCGAIQDFKSIPDLLLLFNDPEPLVQLSACAAIGAIRHPTSFQILSETIDTGSEYLRHIAAECLAMIHPEGHERLKLATQSEDLLTRRAAIAGLARISEEWSLQILKKLSLDDSQWVVRNAAAHVVEVFENSHPYSVTPFVELSEIPWLVRFSSKNGKGLSPGDNCEEILMEVIRGGNDAEITAAVGIASYFQPHNLVPELLNLLASPDPDIKTSAYMALWYYQASGMPITR